MKRGLVILLLLISIGGSGQIKEAFDSIYFQSVNDSVERYIRKHPSRFKPKENKFQPVPLLTIGYTQEDGFGVIAGVTGIYRPGFDTNTPYSLFSAIGYVSTKMSVKGIFNGYHYLKSSKSRIEYKLLAFNDTRRFWGIGYSDQPTSDLGVYTEGGADLMVGYRYLFTPSFSAKISVGYEYYTTYDYTYSYLVENEITSTTGAEVSLNITADTRDIKHAPQKGIYIDFNQTYHPRFYFGKTPYFKTSIVADFFFPAWEGSVFAFDLWGEANYGKTPWFTWTPIGGESRMRGYYYGRYRDKNTATAQLEIRQQIYQAHSMVIWGGCGNTFPSLKEFNIKHTLPTYGIGYRMTLAELVFRFDLGFGNKKQYSILVGINHAF